MDDWLAKRRRLGFNDAMKFYRKVQGRSTPGPTTSSGWETLFGTDVVSGTAQQVFKTFSPAEQERIFKTMDVVFACVSKLARTAIEPPLRVLAKTKDGEKEVDHVALDVLKRPNRWMSHEDLVFVFIANWFLTGAAHLWERRLKGGTFDEFWPIPTSWIKEDWTNNTLRSFKVTPRRGDSFVVIAEDMTVLRFNDPGNPLRFVSPLGAAARAVQTDQGREEFMFEMLENTVRPGLAMMKAEPWSEDEKRAARSRLEDRAGKGKRGAPIFIGGENAQLVLVEPLKDLDWPGLSALSETRIASVFGVPPILIGLRSGLDRATYANADQADRHFFQTTMIHIWKSLENAWTRGLLFNEGETGLRFSYDLSQVRQLQENENEKSDRALKQFQGGLISRNEGRELIGKEPLGAIVGNIILQPIALLEISVEGGEAQQRQGNLLPPPDKGEIEENDDVEEVEEGETDDNGKSLPAPRTVKR